MSLNAHFGTRYRMRETYSNHDFNVNSLPLEIALNDGDFMWVGRTNPPDTFKYKLWLQIDVDSYETIIKIVGD